VKAKRKLLIGLFVIIVLAGYYFLATDYRQQRQQQEILNQQIAETTQALARLSPPPADLEPRLAAAQDNLNVSRDAFPDMVNSTRVVDAILKLAEEIGVKAIPLVSQREVLEKKGEHGYYVLRLNVFVSGSFSQLEDFAGRLENGELATLVIERLDINRGEAPSVVEDGTDSEKPVFASIDLAVYARSLPGGS